MLDSLRILYIDAFTVASAWANTQGLSAAYSRVGDLCTYDYRAEARKVRAPWSRPEIWDQPEWKPLVQKGLYMMRQHLIDVAIGYQPHLVHLGKCEYLDGETVSAIKKHTDAFVVHYYGDFWHEVKPWVVDIAKHADWTLFCHQDPEIISRYQQAGCERIGYWQAGTDSSVYFPRHVSGRIYDVVFMGRPNIDTIPQRASVLRALVDEGLAVHAFSGNWSAIQDLHLAGYHKFVDADEFATACSQAKIVLSIDICARMYTSWRRVFNSMASGAFLLIRYFPGLETVFENHKHVVWFDTDAEAVEQAKYYIAHDSERLRIAALGCRLVRAKHTWDARVAEILSLYQVAKQ